MIYRSSFYPAESVPKLSLICLVVVLVMVTMQLVWSPQVALTTPATPATSTPPNPTGLSQLFSQRTVHQEVIGTPPRQEVEVKLALNSAQPISAHTLSLELHALMQTLQARLTFSQVAGCQMTVDRAIQSFAFIDEYFDTPAKAIMTSNSAYRLRRRWQNYQHFLRHQLFFWSKLFGATRVEIQAKTGYHRTATHQLSVLESRLEFRPEAPPFNQGFPLPNITKLSTHELHQMMTSGQFHNHLIYPFTALTDHPPLHNVDLSTLNHELTLASQRNRFHLSCPHPLGWGPNPDQVFIVTIDKVRCLSGCCQLNELLTIELERERNTTTHLDELARYEDSAYFTHPVALLGLEYSKNLRLAHINDHHFLTAQLKNFIQSKGWSIANPTPKYHRFSCQPSTTQPPTAGT